MPLVGPIANRQANRTLRYIYPGSIRLHKSSAAGLNATIVNMNPRRGHEPPPAVAHDGWRYHHIGIPSPIPRPGEIYLAHLKVYVSGFESSPYGIQWMRFDHDAPYPEIVMTVPHVAFEVDDLAAAIAGRDILIAPNSPSSGVTVAMILSDGAPVELLEFRR